MKTIQTKSIVDFNDPTNNAKDTKIEDNIARLNDKT